MQPLPDERARLAQLLPEPITVGLSGAAV